MTYAEAIRETLAEIQKDELNVRHVEAFMRLEHPTLDGLPAWQFRSEVRIAAECVELAGPRQAEALARSYGLIER